MIYTAQYPLGRHESRATTYVPLSYPLMPMHDEQGRLTHWEDAPTTGVVGIVQTRQRIQANRVQPVRAQSTLERGVRSVFRALGLLALCLSLFVGIFVGGFLALAFLLS